MGHHEVDILVYKMGNKIKKISASMVTNGISIDWKRAKYIRTIDDRLRITRDDMKYTFIHLVRRGV